MNVRLLFLLLFFVLSPSSSERLYADDILTTPNNMSNFTERAQLWPRGKVYYTIAQGEFSRIQTASLMRSIWSLEKVSCVKFIPKSKNKMSYVRFRNFGRRCAASIGYKPNRVFNLYLGWPDCHKKGTMQHEILHALGMWHEHMREDRDQHIDVIWDNIAKGKEFNFKLTPKDATTSLPYDYGSVMHYRYQAFSKTGRETTIYPKYKPAFRKMGQRKGPTQIDIAKLNRLYNCPSKYYKGNDIEKLPFILSTMNKHNSISENEIPNSKLSKTESNKHTPKKTESNKHTPKKTESNKHTPKKTETNKHTLKKNGSEKSNTTFSNLKKVQVVVI